MQGHRSPSFLPTKKKPAEAGWSDRTLGQLLLMYASITFFLAMFLLKDPNLTSVVELRMCQFPRRHPSSTLPLLREVLQYERRNIWEGGLYSPLECLVVEVGLDSLLSGVLFGRSKDTGVIWFYVHVPQVLNVNLRGFWVIIMVGYLVDWLSRSDGFSSANEVVDSDG